MKRFSVILLIIAMATTSLFAGNGHFGLGVGYAKDVVTDKNIPATVLKNGLDSVGLQLNSYTMFGKYVGIFGNTAINYGFKYNYEWEVLGIKKSNSLTPKHSLAIDAQTMLGLGFRIPFGDSFSMLLGVGAAASATYIQSKDIAPLDDIRFARIGLGAGGDVQLRFKSADSVGFSAGLAGSMYFKYYEISMASKEFKGLEKTTGYVINPYIMVSF